jgi:Amt family ammonium transporter
MTVPFQDFAGSTVVHSVGGWASLVGAIMVGARLGKFDENGKPRLIGGHNMTIATLGTLILWLGWFGFNPGSTLAAQGSSIAHVTVTTMMAASAGLASSMILSWMRTGKADLGVILNGTLAGLVAITAGCNAVSVTGSVLIGLIAGVLCTFAGPLIEKLRIDDPVGALSVHLVNGIWGTLAVGLFATKAGSVGTFDGLFYGGGTALLTSQLIGVLCIGGFTVAGSVIFWFLVKAILGLRVPAHSEVQGIDLEEHGGIAYPIEDSSLLPIPDGESTHGLPFRHPLPAHHAPFRKP